jgi:single-strand DNA-binding protein
MGLENKVTLIGRVGQDVDFKTLTGGVKVANVSLATTERYKDDKGELKTNTEWHKLVFFGAKAELVNKWVEKGNQIGVEGKLKYDKWIDKDTGSKKSSSKVVCSEVMFLERKNKEGEKDVALPF